MILGRLRSARGKDKRDVASRRQNRQSTAVADKLNPRVGLAYILLECGRNRYSSFRGQLAGAH